MFGQLHIFQLLGLEWGRCRDIFKGGGEGGGGVGEEALNEALTRALVSCKVIREENLCASTYLCGCDSIISLCM